MREKMILNINFYLNKIVSLDIDGSQVPLVLEENEFEPQEEP